MSNKVSEILNRVKKALFADETVTDNTVVEPVDTASAPTVHKLADGTEVSIDKLEVGGSVMMNELPAPEGDYTLEDGTKFTVGLNGVISALTAVDVPVVDPVPADDFTTPEGVHKAFQKFADGTPPDMATLTAMVKALFENVFGWQLREAQEKATRDQAIAAYQTKFDEQKGTIKDLFTVVEELAQNPVAQPIEAPKNAIQNTGLQQKEEKMRGMADALKNFKPKYS